MKTSAFHKSSLYAMLFTVCLGSFAAAQTFTVDISTPEGDSNVSPGEALMFEITGTLSADGGNLGLAFFAFDLELDGPTPVALSTAMVFDTEDGTVVDSFSKPEGYSIDFTGTPVGDDLIQLGGGQNTIGNDPLQDPMVDFPDGMVAENVAHTTEVLFSGTITLPEDVTGDATYTLRIKPGSLFANYIDADNGDGTYDVEQVSSTIIGGELGIVVQTCLAPASVELVYAGAPGADSPVTFPCPGYIDPRRETAAGTAGLDTVTLVFNAEVVDAGSASLTEAAFTVVENCGGGAAPTVAIVDSTVDESTGRHVVTLQLSSILTLQEWTTIQADVESLCGGVAITNTGDAGDTDRLDLAFLPGDISQNGRVDALDLLRMRQKLGGTCTSACPSCNGDDDPYFDIARNGGATAFDLLVWRQTWFGTGQSTQAWQGVQTACSRP